MSRRKLVKAVAAGHLVCRTLALLAQFGLLIVFIHISATDGGIMFAKYLYVSLLTAAPRPQTGELNHKHSLLGHIRHHT